MGLTLLFIPSGSKCHMLCLVRSKTLEASLTSYWSSCIECTGSSVNHALKSLSLYTRLNRSQTVDSHLEIHVGKGLANPADQCCHFLSDKILSWSPFCWISWKYSTIWNVFGEIPSLWCLSMRVSHFTCDNSRTERQQCPAGSSFDTKCLPGIKEGT